MIRRASTLVALAAVACGGSPPEPSKLPPLPPVVAPPSAPTAAAGAPDRSKLPTPAPAPSFALPRPKISALSNGMKVYFVEQGPTPLVSVLLVVPRGASTDPKGKAGLTALTIDMLDEGAGGKDALALSEELQRLGTDYGGNADVDYVMLAINTIADSFDASVTLLADIAQKPAFDAKEFARRKSQRIADALAAESEPTSARSIALRKALFGDGYAGALAGGTRPTLGKLQLADVKAHYAALVVPEGAAFVVVGGVDQARAVKALEANFGSWKGSAKSKSASVSSEKPDKAIFFVDYKDSTQTALAIARRAPGEGTPDYFPAMVMSRVFGEAFTSRLNLNLREAKGYTYGARSSFQRYKETGLFALAASVKRETTRASIDESFKELRDLCASRPISAQERAEAVGGLLLGFPGRFERGGDVAAQLANLPLYSRPDDWLEKWSDHVKAVSVQQANELAKGFCNPDEYVVVLAGDRKVVAPTLEGLDRKIRFFDAQGNPVK